MLLNYTCGDSNPILAADDPFGKYFDSSMVWESIVGQSINAGVRFILEEGGSVFGLSMVRAVRVSIYLLIHTNSFFKSSKTLKTMGHIS